MERWGQEEELEQVTEGRREENTSGEMQTVADRKKVINSGE
jgi:hypothetical protein